MGVLRFLMKKSWRIYFILVVGLLSDQPFFGSLAFASTRSTIRFSLSRGPDIHPIFFDERMLLFGSSGALTSTAADSSTTFVHRRDLSARGVDNNMINEPAEAASPEHQPAVTDAVERLPLSVVHCWITEELAKFEPIHLPAFINTVKHLTYGLNEYNKRCLSIALAKINPENLSDFTDAVERLSPDSDDSYKRWLFEELLNVEPEHLHAFTEAANRLTLGMEEIEKKVLICQLINVKPKHRSAFVDTLKRLSIGVSNSYKSVIGEELEEVEQEHLSAFADTVVPLSLGMDQYDKRRLISVLAKVEPVRLPLVGERVAKRIECLSQGMDFHNKASLSRALVKVGKVKPEHLSAFADTLHSLSQGMDKDDKARVFETLTWVSSLDVLAFVESVEFLSRDMDGKSKALLIERTRAEIPLAYLLPFAGETTGAV